MGLQGVDLVFGVLDAADGKHVVREAGPRNGEAGEGKGRGRSYENPLIRLYSWPILPPESSACFFAAATCSGVASDLQVTLRRLGLVWERGQRRGRTSRMPGTHNVGRHVGGGLWWTEERSSEVQAIQWQGPRRDDGQSVVWKKKIMGFSGKQAAGEGHHTGFKRTSKETTSHYRQRAPREATSAFPLRHAVAPRAHPAFAGAVTRGGRSECGTPTQPKQGAYERELRIGT